MTINTLLFFCISSLFTSGLPLFLFSSVPPYLSDAYQPLHLPLWTAHPTKSPSRTYSLPLSIPSSSRTITTATNTLFTLQRAAAPLMSASTGRRPTRPAAPLVFPRIHTKNAHSRDPAATRALHSPSMPRTAAPPVPTPSTAFKHILIQRPTPVIWIFVLHPTVQIPTRPPTARTSTPG